MFGGGGKGAVELSGKRLLAEETRASARRQEHLGFFKEQQWGQSVWRREKEGREAGDEIREGHYCVRAWRPL